MVKKHGLWYFIKYYQLIFYLLSGICLLIVPKYILPFLPKGNLLLYHICRFAIPAILFAFWGLSFFISTRRKTYYYLTGRNYKEDVQLYQRSYKELTEFWKNSNPYKMNEDTLPDLSWRDAEGVILGKTKNDKLIHVPSGRDGRNFFIFGLPGTGKTDCIICLSCLRFGAQFPYSPTSLLPDNEVSQTKNTTGSVFCIDQKNDIYKATHRYRKIKRFNLIDKINSTDTTINSSCHYNPFAGIEHMSIDERCNFIERLGYNLISSPSDSDSQYFADTAHDFWNGICLHMLHENINTSFPDVIKAILAGNPIGWIETVIKGNSEQGKRRLASKFGENPKNLSGSYAKLCQGARLYASETLFYLLDNKPEYEYISAQTLEDGYDCYISVSPAEIDNYAAVISMITQGILQDLLIRDMNPKAGRLKDGTLRPLLICLDEFSKLRYLDYNAVLAPSFMLLRAKNVSILAACQSLSSLTQMLNSSIAAKTLIDCTSTFCFLSIQEVETREWATKLIGNKKVLCISNSISEDSKGSSSTGRSVHESSEPIIPEAEWGNLIDPERGKDEMIVYSKGKYIRTNKIYYHKERKQIYDEVSNNQSN